jgi:hypothetical protein
MLYKSVLLMLNSVEHWINVPLEGSTIKKASSGDEYEDYDEESDIIVVWETAVQPLTDIQRLIFLTLTVIVVTVSVVGNILVLYVNFSRFGCEFFICGVLKLNQNFHRKQRFLFRACLISLALSDLIFVVVTSIIYISKFMTPNVALWVKLR